MKSRHNKTILGWYLKNILYASSGVLSTHESPRISQSKTNWSEKLMNFPAQRETDIDIAEVTAGAHEQQSFVTSNTGNRMLWVGLVSLPCVWYWLGPAYMSLGFYWREKFFGISNCHFGKLGIKSSSKCGMGIIINWIN